MHKYANNRHTTAKLRSAGAVDLCGRVALFVRTLRTSTNMNWDNGTVLQFLELYKMNSCIWNPHDENHKNRPKVIEAWDSIRMALGDMYSVKEMKRKKESLMAMYRNYKAKIKKSELAGSDPIYQPSWFAFPLMESFLGSIYVCNITQDTQDMSVEYLDDDDTDTTENNEHYETKPSPSNIESVYIKSASPLKWKQKKPKENRQQIFNAIKQELHEDEYSLTLDDESTIFGQLVAKKIRKLSDERRDIMMVKINQLFVDEHSHNNSKSRKRPYNGDED